MDALEATAADVVDSALLLHRQLGPGLLESVYETVLAAELRQRGYPVLRQQPVDFTFNGMRFDGAFKADLIVGPGLVVEIKSVERLSGVHVKQLLTYLAIDGAAPWAAHKFRRRNAQGRGSSGDQ